MPTLAADPFAPALLPGLSVPVVTFTGAEIMPVPPSTLPLVLHRDHPLAFAGTVDQQGARADNGRTAVGVRRRERHGARAYLDQRAGTADRIGHADVVRAGKNQGSVVDDVPSAQAAAGAAAANLERAAADRGRPRVGVRSRERFGAAGLLW